VGFFIIVSSIYYYFISEYSLAYLTLLRPETVETLLTSKEWVYRWVFLVYIDYLEEIFPLFIWIKFFLFLKIYFTQEFLCSFILLNTRLALREFGCCWSSFYMIPALLNVNNFPLNLSANGISKVKFFIKSYPSSSSLLLLGWLCKNYAVFSLLLC